MPRTLISLFAAGALAVSGCAMCQDCQDDLGASPESENYTTYSHGDRAGSAFTGGGQATEYVDMTVEPTPTLAEPRAASQGSSRR